MTRRWVALAPLLALAVLNGAGLAVAREPPSAPSPGDTVTGWLALAGKRVPLPPGSWTIAATEADESVGVGLVAVRVERSRLDAFVVIHANAQPSPAGWGLTRSCGDPGMTFAAIAYASPIDGLCAFGDVLTTERAQLGPSLWRAVLAQAATRGWVVPSSWLMAGVRATDRRDVVDVRYHFAPSAVPALEPGGEVAPAADGLGTHLDDALERVGGGRLWSERRPDLAKPPSALEARMATLAAWVEAVEPLVAAGLGGRAPRTLDAPGLDQVGPSHAALSHAGAVRRIQDEQLRAALAEGGLTAEQGEAVSRALEGAVPSAPEGLARIDARSLAWDVFGFSKAVAIKYLFIQNIWTTLAVQATSQALSPLRPLFTRALGSAWGARNEEAGKPIPTFEFPQIGSRMRGGK